MSNVYFVDLKTRSHNNSKIMKVRRLLEVEEFKDFIREGDITPVKIHFGELGNDSFINPIFVREAVEFIKRKKAKPFVTDTNTLYSGSRHNAVDHINTAIMHGFDYAVIGAPVIIADGLKSKNYQEVEVNLKHFKKTKIAQDIVDSDSMIVFSHFKAHEMAGFGGAIKNLAMGCAPADGKKEQHSVKFYVEENRCVGCHRCVDICPEKAIEFYGKAKINKEKCIGCGECKTVCQPKAIEMDWSVPLNIFMEKMTEYAFGAIKGKENRVIYVNFLINIVPDCDCAGWSDYPIVPDIGILASRDPVSLDKACYDLVNDQVGNSQSILKQNLEKGEDKFKGLRPETDGLIQIFYGEEIGLGKKDYNLIKI